VNGDRPLDAAELERRLLVVFVGRDAVNSLHLAFMFVRPPEEMP
jgi:hypothetical protein